MGEGRPDGGRVVPMGVRLADDRHRQLGLIPDVGVRCRAQPPESPPLFSRDRFAWSLSEVSGAIGDLGTFLPHVIGAIVVVGMHPTGVLAAFGLFYLLSGLYYGVPMGVQPMKAASAAMLITPLAPREVAGAGLVIGAFFLLAGLTGLITRLARMVPPVVAAGLQLGLGFSLAGLGIELIREQPLLGVLVGGLTLALLGARRLPAALIALLAGVGLAQVAGVGEPVPRLELGLHLPGFVWPDWNDVLRGVELAVLPQIPLTLTNAIIVTAAVTRQLLPKEEHHVNERNLAITTGLGNLLAAPLGGYLMCHGAGGITGHYRFGARTATAPALIGLSFLLMGLLLGEGAVALLALVPAAVLGTLLFFSGVELALSSKPGSYAGVELFAVLAIGAVSATYNPAVAFALGLPLGWAVRRGWVRL
ncbi:MAG: putative sulfate/molybdate transporter [Chloroflexota bacterium]|nr:putative sulfate/molybdate transporter [Chloroflexota bacterium]